MGKGIKYRCTRNEKKKEKNTLGGVKEMRNTKIICTLGPAVNDEESIRRLILGGMNTARFNFSHGTHESHLATFHILQRVRDELGLPVAAMLDTKGPEIRLGTFSNGSIEVFAGDEFTLTVDDVDGDETKVSISFKNLHNEVSVGTRILIDDGLIELRVKEIKENDVVCTVINGGTMSNNKSVNIPDVHISLPAVTEKDKSDLRFAVENEFDFIAASFVRSAADIAEIREVLRECGGEYMKIIAKIENREGVDNLEEILDAADGLMVARGDLGVEIPASEVPVLQKHMIKMSIIKGKIVVTATQMLDSMIRNPRATRAEVSDVANAIFDGTSCVMLSGETASGKYPHEALKTMVDTIEMAEKSTNYWKRFESRREELHFEGINNAISHACCLIAKDLKAKAILASTQSGFTARIISRYRPGCNILAMTTTERVRRQLALEWGVYPTLQGQADSTDRMFSLCVDSALKEGMVEKGDTVVITAGVPIGKVGSTNLIKAQVV